jgi:Domain of unknown function (DUF1902)
MRLCMVDFSHGKLPTSEDVPGLATEAETLEALTEKLRGLIPELLEANPQF